MGSCCSASCCCCGSGGEGDLAAVGRGACSNQKICPVADAGPDQFVETGNLATLDGSGSVDPNPGDTLAYSWRFQSMPTGSTATLNNPTTISPTFTPDLDGFYVLSLIVTDSLGASSPLDMVVIQTGPRFTLVPGTSNAVVLDHTTNLQWE